MMTDYRAESQEEGKEYESRDVEPSKKGEDGQGVGEGEMK